MVPTLRSSSEPTLRAASARTVYLLFTVLVGSDSGQGGERAYLKRVALFLDVGQVRDGLDIDHGGWRVKGEHVNRHSFPLPLCRAYNW